MNQKLLFISLLIIGLNCFSQDRIPGTYFTVLAPSGLNIREKPNQNSSISTTIPFGTEVKADFSKMIPATINGFTGGWVPVAYEGKDGYAWSQYLAEITIPGQENINNDFRVIQEGAFCGELNYMPDLTWYGIYKTNKPGIRELKKVEIEVVVKSTLKEDEKEAYFGEDKSNADFLITKSRAFFAASLALADVKHFWTIAFPAEGFSSRKVLKLSPTICWVNVWTSGFISLTLVWLSN